MTNPLSDPEFVAGLRPIPSGVGDAAPAWAASDLDGVRPDGTPVTVSIADTGRPVLLVFLSTGCDGCDAFWQGLSEPPSDVEVVVVTKGPDAVSAAEVAILAGGAGDLPVVMSDTAWSDYRVTGYPFLVLVEPGSRRIVGESVGFAWPDVGALVAKLDRGSGEV